MSPRITIGLATFNDFEGTWSTVRSIFLHNDWASPDDVEVIIVDTSPPGSEHKRLVKDLVARKGLTYVEMPTVIGTTYPRDYVFQIAKAPFTVVMDCHVMLPSNVLLRLLNWFEANPDCADLIHGPLLYDDDTSVATHFADQFRGGMWGTWSSVWLAPDGTIFSTEGEEVTDENKIKRFSTGRVSYHDVMTLAPLEGDFPDLAWAGHQRHLNAMGYVELGQMDSDIPFEIPGQGMGFFASATDKWLGFAQGCSGFGGEELNIHTKYRLAGRKALCLPFLKWNHRFGRVGGAPYPIPLAAKMRNYVLWATQMGNPVVNGKPLLDRIATHFVSGGMFPKTEWFNLLSDPINYPVNLTPAPTSSREEKPLDALFSEVANKPRDLNEHAEAIQSLVFSCSTVTAFVKRGEWETILASGFPKVLNVYQTENSPLIQRTHEAHEKQSVKNNRKLEVYNTHTGPEVDPLQVESIEPCDLLVLDQVMRADYVTAVLNKHASKASKYILLRGTQAFGEKAEFDTTQPGLFAAIKEFLANNPEWFIISHRHNQYGMTVLCKDQALLPENEVVPWPKGYGPGTELKAILSSVGINPSANCSCNARMRTMDDWGIEGCKENFDTIVGWLEEKAAEWGWINAAEKAIPSSPEIHKLTLAEKLSIGWKSLYSGIAFKVDWTNPYPGLVTESIRRAEENQPKSFCKKTGCDPSTCENKQCKKK